MKRVWIIAVVALLLVAVVVGYYGSALDVASDAAASIAADDGRILPHGNPLALGSGVAAGGLVVKPRAGWLAISPSLSFVFDVSDKTTGTSVHIGVDVEFTPQGWRVAGAGDAGN
jgi:hypothetical protein